jgi:hypothetical protein
MEMAVSMSARRLPMRAKSQSGPTLAEALKQCRQKLEMFYV